MESLAFLAGQPQPNFLFSPREEYYYYNMDDLARFEVQFQSYEAFLRRFAEDSLPYPVPVPRLRGQLYSVNSAKTVRVE